MKHDVIAYCSNEAVLRQINVVLEDLKLENVASELGGYERALKALSNTASPRVLVVDMSQSEEVIKDLSALANVVEPGTEVVLMGDSVPLQSYRDILKMGVLEYFEFPLNVPSLRQLIAQKLALLGDDVPLVEPSSRGQLITVSGLQGGVGVTSIVAALSSQLSKAGCYTLTGQLDDQLGDLDLYWGDLDGDVVSSNAVEYERLVHEQVLKRAIHPISSRLHWLNSKQSRSANGVQMKTVLNLFKSQFAYTVLDCSSEHPHAPTAWQSADICIWVCEPCVSLVKRWRAIQSQCGNNGHTRHIFVVNQTRPERSKQVAMANLVSLFGQEVLVIPYAQGMIQSALNAGRVDQLDKGKAGRAFHQLLDKVQLTPSKPSQSFMAGILDYFKTVRR